MAAVSNRTNQTGQVALASCEGLLVVVGSDKDDQLANASWQRLWVAARNDRSVAVTDSQNQPAHNCKLAQVVGGHSKNNNRPACIGKLQRLWVVLQAKD